MANQNRIVTAQKEITDLLFDAMQKQGYKISERRFGDYQKHVAVKTKNGDEFTVRLSVVHGDVFGMFKEGANESNTDN